jgi:prepilin-type N-terminal cleavage/methylation domain-containing protein
MNKKGFTLIELLAIIVILGILAAISTSMVGNYIKNSKKDATRVTAQTMINAVLDDLELLEIRDETPQNKTYDFKNADKNLLEKPLTKSAWEYDIEQAKVYLTNYDNISICIKDTKGNGIKGTEDQIKNNSKDLIYENITCE